MTVTLNDVARRAGVSKSTVSNVVRGAAPVAVDTRRRVEGAISELGYRPNEVARALKQRATQTLGLVITDTVNPFAASLAQAVVRRARRDGYAVLIADTDGDQEIEAAQCRALVARRVDGVIFGALTEGSTSLGDLLDRGVPTVLASFGGRLDRRAGAIDIDEEVAMEAVVGYLADLGHERIAFARQPAREAEVDRRPTAFSQAVARLGLQEVSLHDAPTAVCCMNDGIAIDLMDALERDGTRVPEDVSVVGFDDVPLASHHRIRLTTVRQDATTIGTRAAELLLAAVAEGRHVEAREVMRGELIVRDSTGPRKAAVSAVSYRGVEKRFDQSVLALKSLDLDVPDGKFLVLLGPSGCGKTTALRILAGLELPTAGAVHIGERDVTRVQPRDRDIAMVFQSYALYPHMTVEENVGYPLRVRKLAKAERREQVLRVAESLEIAHLLDRRPAKLSGGQRQRVALARAIVREPSVFLMDEPLSNLDAKLRTSMRGEIKRLQTRLATTTLYVTHDQAEAMTMADLVAVMRDGELLQLGSPDEIYDRPASRFVGAFVGSPPMNVLDGVLDRDRGGLVISGSRLSLPVGMYQRAAEADVTAIGVRPEDLLLTGPGDNDGDGSTLTGEVYVVEPMGNETLVDVRVGDQRVMVRAPRSFNAAIGSPIGVRVTPESACLFRGDGTTALHRSDRASERRETSV